jgi:hypothetical protein
MFLLNLSVMEFGALLGVLGSLITALYLLDQARRKRVVSTLRFWTSASMVRQNRRRRRVQEPWSLILQLVSLLLLLLAVAQLQLGSRARRGRDHVVLLDTSAWSAQQRGAGTLLDAEKQSAAEYISAIPARDRVLLVAVDALATPLTPFTSDRAKLAAALRAVSPSFAGLNLEQAFLFAQQARHGSENEPGEVVYIGPEMVARSDAADTRIRALRVIPIAVDREHTGIRGVSIQRSVSGAAEWQARVTLRNYGARAASVSLRVQCGPAFGRRSLSLGAGEETTAEFMLAMNTATEFVADIDTGSDLQSDHHVALELPTAARARVDVVTSRADRLRLLFPVNAQVAVRFFEPNRYTADPNADLVVWDQTAGSPDTARATIWIDPPRDQAPWPVKAVVENASIAVWHSETPLASGLRTRQTHLGRASVFHAFEGDHVVASAAAGPVVIARDAERDAGKRAAIGFDPLNARARFEMATPLLFANLLRWSLPDVFQTLQVNAERVGAIAVPLDAGQRADSVRVDDELGRAAPFVATRKSIELFVSRPQVLKLVEASRQRTLSAVLPEVPTMAWTPPANALSGLPPSARFTPGAADVWRVLAVLGGLGLFAEWTLFGRQRKFRRRARDGSSRGPSTTPERELAAK